MERFPVDFVVSSFQTCNLKHYLDVIQELNAKELAELRTEIKRHRAKNRSNGAFVNAPNLSTQQALLKAVTQERLRRSGLLPIVRFFLPARQVLVRAFSGLELEDNEHFGPIYTQPTRRRSFLHISHEEMIRVTGAFLSKNWFNLASLVIAAIAVVVTWLKP